MSLNKYVADDLDNDLEAIFADMMDDGFEVKKITKEPDLFDVIIIKANRVGLSFNIVEYKDHIKQLLDIMNRKGIQVFKISISIKGRNVLIDNVDNILTSSVSTRSPLYSYTSATDMKSTDFTNKSFEEIWDAITFNIYCLSENDAISNITITFCEK